MAYTYSSKPVLSKVKIGEQIYYLKDADVRAIIDGYNNEIVTGTIGAVDGGDGNAFVRASDIKKYVDKMFSVGLTIEVVTELPTASAAEMGKLYLKAHAHGEQDAYDEYIVVRSGAPEAYEYKWEKIGNTDVSLSSYYTKDEADKKISDAVAAEKTRATGVEGGLDTRIKAIEDKPEVSYTAKENGGLQLEGTAFSIKEVSADLLKDGTKTLILNGGGAAE